MIKNNSHFNLLHHKEVTEVVVRWKVHALHKLMYRNFIQNPSKCKNHRWIQQSGLEEF